MAANLVRRYPPDAAHHLLNLSFAQYRADRDVVRLEAQLERTAQHLEDARHEADCELGRRGGVPPGARPRTGGEVAAGRPPTAGRAGVVDALERVKPGDVLVLAGGKSRGPGGRALDGPAPGRRRAARRASPPSAGTSRCRRRDFAQAARGRRSHRAARRPTHLATRRSSGRSPRPWCRPRPGPAERPADATRRRHVARLGRRCTRSAPAPTSAATCGRPSGPSAWRRTSAGLERRIQGRTESLARQFDRVLRVLEAWGYVDGWSLTEAGEQLAGSTTSATCWWPRRCGPGCSTTSTPPAVAAPGVGLHLRDPRGREGAAARGAGAVVPVRSTLQRAVGASWSAWPPS